MRAKCSVSQIEVVPEEEFEIRAKELGHTYTITSPPKIAPIPSIYMDDISFGLNKHKLRTYTESDVVGYNKKISKRRKKNKNKKLIGDNPKNYKGRNKNMEKLKSDIEIIDFFKSFRLDYKSNGISQ